MYLLYTIIHIERITIFYKTQTARKNEKNTNVLKNYFFAKRQKSRLHFRGSKTGIYIDITAYLSIGQFTKNAEKRVNTVHRTRANIPILHGFAVKRLLALLAMVFYIFGARG